VAWETAWRAGAVAAHGGPAPRVTPLLCALFAAPMAAATAGATAHAAASLAAPMLLREMLARMDDLRDPEWHKARFRFSQLASQTRASAALTPANAQTRRPPARWWAWCWLASCCCEAPPAPPPARACA
jgi:hypothetical protein